MHTRTYCGHGLSSSIILRWVRTDAMALMRSQELTGAATSLDFSWPCNHEIKIDLR